MSGTKQQRGGKYATPIRNMLKDNNLDGIIFQCDDADHAESVRVCTLVLKERNGYDYKTSVHKNLAMIFKEGRSWGDDMLNIDLRDKEKETNR